MSEHLEQGQQLVKSTMNSLVDQRQSLQQMKIQAQQEFREEYQESYEEAFEEETFIDSKGNKSTKRTETSSESKERTRSADVKVKASGLSADQVKALTDCANEATQLALDSKPADN